MNQRTAQKLQNALARTGRPMTPGEAAAAAGLSNRPDRFAALVNELTERGEILTTRAGNLIRPADAGLICAEIVSQSPHFCFAQPTDGTGDIYIDRTQQQRALPGDLVLVGSVTEQPRGRAGAVVRILRAGPHRVTGQTARGDGIVLRCDRWVRFPVPLRGAARIGQKVLAELRWQRDGQLIAQLCTAYGSAESAHVCADSVLDGYGIPTEFSPEVMRAAARCSAALSPEELQTRLDLRDTCILTIDGADAKDLDDAISVARDGDGWQLGVHIADVSHYVTARSAIDREARLRGTSVYFADRVVPMLPEAISNGVCSLQPDGDKRAFSALIHLDATGAITDYRFCKTVIRSRVRGVYSEVNALFDGTADKKIREKYAAVLDTLREARRLAARLRQRAADRGYMALDTVESKFTLDADGVCIAIAPRISGEAEQLIEQLMLTANEAAARLARSRRLPFVYRTHAHPAPERLAALSEMLGKLGIPTELPPDVSPRALADLLERTRPTPYFQTVSFQLLRTMAKAKYDPEPAGHFGLALADYSHFTSPIRRYADLAVHRILSDAVSGVPDSTVRRRYGVFAPEAARLASETEIRAMNAERDAEDCYAAEWMRGHLGESFPGTVSGVTERGVYVRLANTAEGMIPADSLGLTFDGALQYVNTSRGLRVGLGDSIAVTAVRADVSAGQIDFAPTDAVYGAAPSASVSERSAGPRTEKKAAGRNRHTGSRRRRRK